MREREIGRERERYIGREGKRERERVMSSVFSLCSQAAKTASASEGSYTTEGQIKSIVSLL